MAALLPPPPPPPPPHATLYTNRFMQIVSAPHPPKLPFHPNGQPLIRPISAYGPHAFPSLQPPHPHPDPQLNEHTPYNPTHQDQASVNAFIQDFQHVGGPPIVPVVWPLDLTGRPPTAKGRVHAAPNQQVGQVALLVHSPVMADIYAINAFNVFSGRFLGSVACRSSDNEYPQPHGLVRDFILNDIHHGYRFVSVLTTTFSEGLVYGPNSTGYAQAAVYRLPALPPPTPSSFAFNWSPLAFRSRLEEGKTIDALVEDHQSIAEAQIRHAKREEAIRSLSVELAALQRRPSVQKLSSLAALEHATLSQPRQKEVAELDSVALDSIWTSPRKRAPHDTDPSSIEVRAGGVENEFGRPALLTPPGNFGSLETPRSRFISTQNLFGNVASREQEGNPNLPASRLIKAAEAMEDKENRSRLSNNLQATLLNVFDILRIIALPVAVANDSKILPPFMPASFSPFANSLGVPYSSSFWGTTISNVEPSKPRASKPRESRPRKRSLAKAETSLSKRRGLGLMQDEEEELKLVDAQMKGCRDWGVGSEPYWEEMLEAEERFKRVEEAREKGRDQGR